MPQPLPNRILLTSCIALLSACQSPAPTTPGTEASNFKAATYLYECGDHFEFVARLNKPDTVWLFLPQQTEQLPRQRSASGARFGDGDIQLWTKDNEATLSRRDQADRHCKNNPRRAVWEAAKLSGVQFRASGNEPGWHIEITPDESISYTGDYGHTQLSFNYQAPLVSPETRTTVYQSFQDGHRVKLTIQGSACSDSMSGEQFESTVSLLIDQQELKGCGRTLY